VIPKLRSKLSKATSIIGFVSHVQGELKMQAQEAGAILCELSRSEMGYTGQTPQGYVSSILAAALREGYPWPVFIQGDHFQVNAKKFAADRKGELEALRGLTAEAIEAGFYNIDVDTSTLVDLSLAGHEAQQALNGGLCAELTAFIRTRELASRAEDSEA